MGKHKKHGYGHKSSSSSSSSSSSDDEYKHLPKAERKRMKKLKKQMKKGHLPPGSVPGMYPGGHGPPHAGGYPSGHGYPTGHAPPPGQYPAAGGYPAPGGYPAAGGYPQPGYPGGAPPPGGYPAGAPGYPAPNPSYPGQPHMGAGGFAPPPPSQYPGAPSSNPPGGAPGYQGQSGYSSGAPGGAPPPQTSYPAGAPQQPGYPTGAPGGVPPQQPGYPTGAPQQPAYQTGAPGGAPQQPGYPTGAPGAPHSQAGHTGGPVSGQPVYHPGQPGAGGMDQAAAQFQRMGLQGGPRGTVRPAANFSAEKDAEIIRQAMKGAGTDEQAIIGVISQRSNQQRIQIMNLFKTMYGKDLIKDLESELSGDFRETIMAMFKPTTYFDAWSLHEAISGLGTKEAVLIEILCTRTNAEIKEILACYQQYYKRSLEKDINDDTSGHFKRLLVSCCQANRTELTPDQWQKMQQSGPEAVIDRALAQQDAQKLYQAGEKKLGTDESAFLTVLAVRHEYQLRATFEEYVKISGRDILNTIDREMSGDLKEGFKAIVMSCRNRPEYFADKLYAAMKGAGTMDSTLIRIIVSRSEIDLQSIKEVYLAKYQKTLAKTVSSDTSGDYKRLLLALIGQ